MIAYPAPLQAVGGARTGIAPLNLLDVVDVNGNLYYWSDRRCTAPIAVTGAIAPTLLTPPVAPSAGQLIAWAYPTDDVADGGNAGTASASGPSGALGLSYQGPFTTGVLVNFAGFTPPPLPPGAVIDAIYAVAQTSGAPAHWMPTDFEPGSTGSQPYLTHAAGQIGKQLTPATLATVESFSTQFKIWNTVGPDPGDEVDHSVLLGYDIEFWAIYEIAIAIYYHIEGRTIGQPGTPGVAPGSGIYQPWLLTVPALTFHRSSVTDVGSFVLQNLSGDTLARDFEKIMRKSALEGAFFVYRCYQPDAQAPWIEIHGQLTVQDVGVDTVTLKGAPAINPANDDTPDKQYCETCQWRWSSRQCGATGDTECQYSYQTCQVPERILVVLNDYEKNYGETTADVPAIVTNRRRSF